MANEGRCRPWLYQHRTALPRTSHGCRKGRRDAKRAPEVILASGQRCRSSRSPTPRPSRGCTPPELSSRSGRTEARFDSGRRDRFW